MFRRDHIYGVHVRFIARDRFSHVYQGICQGFRAMNCASDAVNMVPTKMGHLNIDDVLRMLYHVVLR